MSKTEKDIRASLPPQNNERGLHSQSLDLMRFPLAVVVLTVHVSLLQFNDTTLTLAAAPFRKFVEVLLHNQSVPIYFFIAGYVFFLKMEMTRKQYARKLRNRVKSLLIPYFIWNLVAILIIAFKNLARCGNGHFHPTIPNLLSCFWMYDGQLEGRTITMPIYPIDLPLWFVRDLIIVVLLAPALYWIIRRARHYWIWTLGAVWLLRWLMGSEHLSQMVTALFFFSWGGYMSIFKRDMIKEFGRYRNASFLGYLGLGIVGWMFSSWQPEWFNQVKDLYILTGLCAAYNLSALLLTRRVFTVSTFLSSASFFIYITHYLVVSPFLLTLLKLLHPGNAVSMTMTYLLCITLITSLLLVVFYLMQRFTPVLLRVVAGRK